MLFYCLMRTKHINMIYIKYVFLMYLREDKGSLKIIFLNETQKNEKRDQPTL